MIKRETVETVHTHTHTHNTFYQKEWKLSTRRERATV